MSLATFKTQVCGDSYEEIVSKAEEEICTFLEIDPSDDADELHSRVNYELIIEQDLEFSAEFSYKAEVIARIR